MSRTGLSRREFLTAASCAAALPASWLYTLGQEIDPRLAKVLVTTIGIDMHNHVYPPGTEPHPHFGPPPGGQRPGDGPPPQPQQPALLLADAIKESGLSVVCASYVLDFTQIEKPGDAMTNYLRYLTAMDEQLEKGRLKRALTLKDIQSAHTHREPAIVQTVEGAQFIEGRPERIEEVYKRGVRHLQLLHMKDDLVAPLGDVVTAQSHLGGLTEMGAKVIHECNRIGMLVDLAHGTAETVRAALKVTTKPILISHTGLDTQLGGNPRMGQMMMPHLISKERAKLVADAGGVVGVWTKLADTAQQFVENIKAMVDTIGVDHVGIGTDSDLLSSRSGQGTTQIWPAMPNGFFPTVAAEMLRQGFSPTEIAKIAGGNYCRIFGQATARHA